MEVNQYNLDKKIQLHRLLTKNKVGVIALVVLVVFVIGFNLFERTAKIIVLQSIVKASPEYISLINARDAESNDYGFSSYNYINGANYEFERSSTEELLAYDIIMNGFLSESIDDKSFIISVVSERSEYIRSMEDRNFQQEVDEQSKRIFDFISYMIQENNSKIMVYRVAYAAIPCISIIVLTWIIIFKRKKNA